MFKNGNTVVFTQLNLNTVGYLFINTASCSPGPADSTLVQIGATHANSATEDFYDAEGFAINPTGFKLAMFNSGADGKAFRLISVSDTAGVAPTEVRNRFSKR